MRFLMTALLTLSLSVFYSPAQAQSNSDGSGMTAEQKDEYARQLHDNAKQGLDAVETQEQGLGQPGSAPLVDPDHAADLVNQGTTIINQLPTLP